ncbi:MAG: hypothetical protein H6Q07_746 [Acidobacteria bacterium]|nr:hypothetical protein [Acidobacteriota bacterium]
MQIVSQSFGTKYLAARGFSRDRHVLPFSEGYLNFSLASRANR